MSALSSSFRAYGSGAEIGLELFAEELFSDVDDTWGLVLAKSGNTWGSVGCFGSLSTFGGTAATASCASTASCFSSPD